MLDFKEMLKGMDARSEFVTTLVILTLEDTTMTGWEKFKYIWWLAQVTSPVTPRFM